MSRSPLALSDNYLTLPEWHRAHSSGSGINPALNYSPPLNNKGKMQGSAISIAEGMAMLGIASESELGQKLKPVVMGLLDDLIFIIRNPSGARYRNIYVERIPRLGKRYDMLGNRIVFIQNKTGKMTNVKLNKINRLNLARANIVALMKQLLMQMPRLQALAEQREQTLAAREAKQLESEINKTEAKLDQLESEAEGAEWVESEWEGDGVDLSPLKKQADLIGITAKGTIKGRPKKGSAVLTYDGASPLGKQARSYVNSEIETYNPKGVDISKQIQLILQKKT